MTMTLRRAPGQPVIYGHRGARGVLPENTMEGFAHLRAIGADGVEMDVRYAAGRVPVVIHDPLMPMQLARDPKGRWLDAPGPRIADLTVAGLQRYDVGRLSPDSPYAGRYPVQRPVDGARIPTLAQFLGWASADPDLVINIEIKSDTGPHETSDQPELLAEDVLALIDAHGVAAQTVVSSFDWRVLDWLRQHAPALSRGHLTYEQPDAFQPAGPVPPWLDPRLLSPAGGSLPRLIAGLDGQAWCVHFRDLTADRLAEAHDLGLAVNAWTVNHASDIARMIAMGVDGVITDYPDLALALRASG